MTYTGGLPSFLIEKPTKIPWQSELLLTLQKSGDYTSELKLNEARSFLCIDSIGEPSLYSYRGNEVKVRGDLYKFLRSLKLPKNSVFDGGHFFRKEVSSHSIVWIFDILVHNGNKVKLPYNKRRAIIEKLFDKPNLYSHVWMSPLIPNFIKEFQFMLNGNSLILQKFAEDRKVDLDIIIQEVEGLVIKKLDYKLQFPTSVKEISTVFKLRKVDVPKNRRIWLNLQLAPV